jgi:type II secretory pathway component PulJ
MRALRTRLERARRAPEAGITLVEMIVVMALSALVMSLLATFLVQVARVSTTSNDRTRSTAVAQNVIDAMSTDIRAGVNLPGNSPVTWAVRPATEMKLPGELLRIITYSDVARPNPIGMPLQVAYTLESGSLVRYVWDAPAASSSYPLASTPTNRRVLGANITSISVSYIQSTCTAPKPSPCTVSTVDTTNMSLISGVTVSMTAQADKSTVPVSLSTTVYMPNAGSTQKYAGS